MAGSKLISSASLTHALGAALTAVFLGLFAWKALLETPAGTADAAELTETLTAARRDRLALAGALEKQQSVAADTRAALDAVGQMPAPIPAETLLQALSALAMQNHLSVLRQHPLSPRTYPGLLEQRFAYEVTGTTHDLARFFKAVESSSAWTDIGYLKVDDARLPENLLLRKANLTFSAFSRAQPPAPQSPAGKPTGGG